MTDIQPNDYIDTLSAAIGSWWFYLTYAFPALVYIVPSLRRWRYILALIPIAFIASCVGYIIYWCSIDYTLMDYYHRTGYFNTADTWYVFMPIFRGLPNAIAATVATSLVGWAVSKRPVAEADLVSPPSGSTLSDSAAIDSTNPYSPPLPTQDDG